MAGHADVGAVTAASPVPEIAAGRLRSIGISSPARLPGVYAEVPTWGEQVWGGRAVDCVVGSWRGVSGPAGLDPIQVAFWQALLSAATATAEWRSELARHFWTEMLLAGATLRDYLGRERGEMRAVLGGLGLLSGSQ